MRELAYGTAILLILAVALAGAAPAHAQKSADWQLCERRDANHEERVKGCSAVIDGGKARGRNLAVAYCNRGFALTERRGDRRFRSGDHDPASAQAYGNRGFAWYRKRNFAKAIADYTQQILLAPSDILIYINRGNAWRDKGEAARTIADYGEVIKRAPQDARGWRNRGLMHLMNGDREKGIADYDQAIKLDANDAYSFNNRGIAKAEKGDRTGAIADLRKALALQPNLQSAQDRLKTLGAAP